MNFSLSVVFISIRSFLRYFVNLQLEILSNGLNKIVTVDPAKTLISPIGMSSPQSVIDK